MFSRTASYPESALASRLLEHADSILCSEVVSESCVIGHSSVRAVINGNNARLHSAHRGAHDARGDGTASSSGGTDHLAGRRHAGGGHATHGAWRARRVGVITRRSGCSGRGHMRGFGSVIAVGRRACVGRRSGGERVKRLGGATEHGR